MLVWVAGRRGSFMGQKKVRKGRRYLATGPREQSRSPQIRYEKGGRGSYRRGTRRVFGKGNQQAVSIVNRNK